MSDNRTELMGTTTVLICNAHGDLDPGATNLIGAAYGTGAEWAAVPLSRLGADFLRLSTGLAGEITQKFAQYRVGLAVVGDLSTHTDSSTALHDFVWEANRGRTVWFVDDLDSLRSRLAG